MTDNTDLSEVLASNYMLASLNISNWSGVRKDRKATDELTTSKNAVKDAADVRKSLFAGCNKELKAAQSAYVSIRGWFYANSLPWSAQEHGNISGSRLVGVTQAMEFLRGFSDQKRTAEEARDKFLSVYDEVVKQAATTLGDLYDPLAYPPKEEVANMFDASLSLNPMPHVADYNRIAIPGAMAQGLQSLFEKQAEKQVQRALTDVQERITEELTRMVRVLDRIVEDEKPRLYKTLITNLQTVTSLAESMAKVSPELARVSDTITTKILEHNTRKVDDFKDNAALARSTSETAKSLLKDLGVEDKPVEDAIRADKPAEPQTDFQSDTFGDFDPDEVFM